MRIILNIFAILIIAAVAFFAVQNAHTMIDFNLWGTVGVNAKIVHINLLYVSLASLVAGMTAGICWLASYYFAAETKLKEYKRKLEKTSVQSSSDSSRVGVLESKIQVLEKALKSALEQKNY